MTKPTGRPRGRPRKEDQTVQKIENDNEDWKSLPWRRIYDIIDDVDDEKQQNLLDNIDEEQFLNFITSQQPSLNPRRLLHLNPLTLRTLASLGKLFCTQEEAAGYLGVSRGALRNFFDREPYAREVFENGLQHAKISLRRKQLALADKNAPAAIFLGKNYLAQKDEHHNTSTTVSVTKMSDAELEQMAATEAARNQSKSQLHS